MSQRNIVLRLLRERGAQGVSSHELTYRFGITRGAAVVFDLRQEGFDISTKDEGTTPDGKQKMARYVLEGIPAALQPKAPVEAPVELAPAVEVVWACGCVRSADGRGWVTRCDDHASRRSALKLEW